MILHFVDANLMIMLLVSALSAVCHPLVDLLAGIPQRDRGGFMVAALLGSIHSFLMKQNWVFGKSIYG